MDSKENPHPEQQSAPSPALAWGVFGVISIASFAYIQVFAHFPSSLSQPEVQQTQAATLDISPAQDPLSTFSSPNNELTFDYPREWNLVPVSDTTWRLENTLATSEATMTMTVEIASASAGIETLLGCDAKCTESRISGAVFTRKEDPATNGTLTWKLGTIKQNTSYILTTTMPNEEKLLDQVESAYESLKLE